jgi:methylthioribose-1-phosphate isomerase
MIAPFTFTQDDTLLFIDQRRLPWEEVSFPASTAQKVAQAIREMVVRGAPAIGIAAAIGLYLGIKDYKGDDPQGFFSLLKETKDLLASTRPTAVNLIWALDRMERIAVQSPLPMGKLKKRLRAEVLRIWKEDVNANRRIGVLGADLFSSPVNILTHCNAGALATGGYGTALGVIRTLHERALMKLVLVDETRPLLQGARLTAWELHKEGIPHRLITDNMAGHFMTKGLVDAVVVGADRIGANGDVANKIGTYTLAVLAEKHGIPFYIAAPISTLDLSTPSGDAIPIEERREGEVTSLGGLRICPEGTKAFNLAFDVTPGNLVTAIITEKGVAQPPYPISLSSLWERR